MVRSELLAALARHHPDLSSTHIDRIVTCMFDTIVDRLASGGRVELRGFGTFATKVHDSRIGRNPRTGDEVAVEAKRVPCFRPGKHMQARLNADRG